MASLVIKNGWFHQILGQSVQNNEFVFIPVLGDLDSELILHSVSEVGKAVFPLSDYIQEKSLKIVADEQDIFGKFENIVWVRARIPAIFGSNILISLSVPDYKCRLTEQMFVACELKSNDRWVAYSFICEDYNLCPRLRFDPDSSLTETYKRIAKAFWELMLREPGRVCAFRDGFLHYDDEEIEEVWRMVTFKRNRFSYNSRSPALYSSE